MRRYFLRKREARALLEALARRGLPMLGGARGQVEVAEVEGLKLFLVGGRPVAGERKGKLFPLLLAPELAEELPVVVVDMGAVPHICNGADVMAPGIVEVRGDFEAGALVRVLDERHGKTIAVGEALVSSGELKTMEKGRAVKNLHYVGDRAWRLAKELQAGAG